MSGASPDGAPTGGGEPTLQAEILHLVADVRALIEDARARGAREEWSDPPPVAPAPVAPAPVGPAPVGPAPVGARPAGPSWTEIAVTARGGEPTGALALSRVRDDLGDCRRCGLCHTRRTIVFGVGSPEARLFLVGEGPGYQEDVQGEPFVGPAGEMLDKMLANVLGLGRDAVYIANVVKCRPPRNRNPLPEEVAACLPFLTAQIRAVGPSLLVTLGAVAFRALFDGTDGIMRHRGRWREFEGIPTMPTLHPAYLLRNPQDKRLVFEDLKAVRARYDALTGRS